MSDELLPLEFGRALGRAVVAVTKKLGCETLLIGDGDGDDDGDVALGKLARVGAKLAIVERPGDFARGKPHCFTCYQVDESARGEFKLDPACALFVLHEQGFYTPADWRLELIRDPHERYNEVMAGIHVALEPVTPRAH